MKIAILTLPLSTNYGGIIQAFALKTILENLGHEVYLIDAKLNKESFWVSLKKLFREYVKNNQDLKNSRFKNKLRNYSYLKYTKPFIDKHFKNITRTFKNPATIGDEMKKYNFDAYVVGSDQIWNPTYYKHIEIAYLSFCENDSVLRIAYAPSFGRDTWVYSTEKEKLCRDLVKKFHAVSIREESGIELCRQHFGIDVKWVLDPTMLLERKDYLKIIPPSSGKKSGKLFTYILDESEEKIKIIEKIAIENGLAPYRLETVDGFGEISLELGTKSSVEDWIRNFEESDFIVTDSFHGTVFSILFNKPFFSVINLKRGATRFQSLLNALNLSDRLLSSFRDLENKNLLEEINWKKVNYKIEEKRAYSLQFLNQSLNKDKVETLPEY